MLEQKQYIGQEKRPLLELLVHIQTKPNKSEKILNKLRFNEQSRKKSSLSLRF